MRRGLRLQLMSAYLKRQSFNDSMVQNSATVVKRDLSFYGGTITRHCSITFLDEECNVCKAFKLCHLQLRKQEQQLIKKTTMASVIFYVVDDAHH